MTNPVKHSDLADGYTLIDSVLNNESLSAVRSEIENYCEDEPLAGIRQADRKFATLRALSVSESVLRIVSRYLSSSPKLVRALLFNKTAENNWAVPWHQDKTVAVSKRFSKTGWGPWSIKDGQHHVQPPLSVLNDMITLRIHIDRADQSNGCLHLIPGSHELGLIDQSKALAIATSQTPVICKAEAGSALVMRPHVLHASRKGTCPSQRRIVHFEYCAHPLPPGVAWA